MLAQFKNWLYLWTNEGSNTAHFDKANNLTMSTLIRVRVYCFDFDGSKSNRTHVQYVESLEEAATMGWKYELA